MKTYLQSQYAWVNENHAKIDNYIKFKRLTGGIDHYN